MKKILVLLAIMLLSSCGGGGSSSDPTTPTDDSTTPTDNTDSSKHQIKVASKTISYVYGETTTKPTATITTNASTTVTGITITGNIGTNVGDYVLTYTATDSAGYRAIPQIATITITPKPITITANPASKVYGEANPVFSDDRTSKLLGSDILSGTLGSNAVNIGTHNITSTLNNNNYIITFIGANKFSIIAGPDNSRPQIIITSNTVSYVYDGTVPTQPTATITDNSTTTGIVITGNLGSNVGTYVLTYNATDSAGNKAIPQTATVIITKKAITITANPASKVFGTANPTFTYVITGGLIAGDILTGNLSSNGVNVGTYTIAIGSLSNNNYDINFVGENKFSIIAKLDNSRPQISITSKTLSYVYDGTTPTISTATITDNSTTTGITITGNIDKNVGTYVLTYTATDSAGNKAIPQIATIAITPKPITITANPATKVFGTANPSFTYVSVGLVPSDTLSGSLDSNGVNVGTYDIISTLSHDNYDINFIGANKFSISPKPGSPNLQIIIASKTLSYVYDGTTPTIKSTATISTSTNTTGIIIAGYIGANVGTYTLIYTATDTTNNNLIREIATIFISPKPVTITASVVSKVYGTANPSFTYVITGGIIASDTLSGGLDSNGVNVGTHTITSTLNHNNYAITFIGVAKFIITKASQPAFSAGNDQDKTFVFGAASGTTFTIMTTGTLSSSPTIYNTSNANIATIDASGVITLKAAGTVTISATSTADNNYNATYASFTLTVYPSTTTLADATAISYGIKLAWSGVVGSSVSYRVYYATKTIIGYTDLATNYHNLPAVLIDNLTTTATTVFNFKHDVIYHFVVTVVQNNIESPISNEATSTFQTPIQLLNDTGVTFAGNYPSGNNQTCVSSITNPQDCHQGRDASSTLVKVGTGRASFDFTKLDSNGDALVTTATNWSCVKDNYTGLIWEVKTNSGLQNVTNTYNWYDTNTNTNGGDAGFANDDGNICYGYSLASSSTYCNTQAFVARVNNVGLCGAKNWQLPSIRQLESIFDYSTTTGIDTDYFPNATNKRFWSSTASSYISSGETHQAWIVDLNQDSSNNVANKTENKNHKYLVRLVRPKPR